MHEYSIIASLIDLCEKQAKEVNAGQIKNVTVQIGKLSGVEPHFMENCFDCFKEDSVCKEASLTMKIIEAKIECKSCNKQSVILNNNFFCPICNSKDTKLIEGKELFIESIEVA